jgi:hypothetical protein
MLKYATFHDGTMMRFFKTVAASVTFLMLAGCGNSALLMLDKDDRFKTALDHTQKQPMKQNTETLAIFRATYLNPIYPETYRGREYFFVGIYIQDDRDRDHTGINNPRFALTLNDQNASTTEPVDENNRLYKSMSMTERWAHYYVVGFDDNTSSKLNLLYKKDTNQNVKFTFPRFVNP